MTDAEIIERIPPDVRGTIMDRVTSGNYPVPVSPGDWMGWLEAEIKSQGLIEGAAAYTLYLSSIALVLRHAFNIEPSQMPWEKI